MEPENHEEVIKESVLINVFEMLVERLSALETKIDRIEEVLENEQSIKYGRINSKAFLDFDVNIYVHKPLPAGESEVSTAPVMYCMSFDVEMDSDNHVELYRTLQRELVRGEYDDTIGNNTDIESIKHFSRFRGLEEEDSWQGTEEEGWLTCEQYSIEPKRVFVHDYILDLKTDRWVSERTDKWSSVRCVMDFGLVVWLEPTEKASKTCSVVKSIQAALDVLNFVGFKGLPEAIEVATLGRSIAKNVSDCDVASIAYLDTKGARAQELKGKIQELQKPSFWKEIKSHPFWGCTLGFEVELFRD